MRIARCLAWLRAVLLALLALAGCAARPASPAAASLPGVAASRPLSYRGLEVGRDQRELGTRLHLPPELRSLRAFTVASGRAVVAAARGEDLVLLLIDDRGVVSDSVELRGRAADLEANPGCSRGDEDVLVAVVAGGACARQRGDVVAVRAWDDRDGALVAVGGPVSCTCFDPLEQP